MNLETAIANLKNKILQKEIQLETYRNPSMDAYPQEVMATMRYCLYDSIQELNNILEELESINKNEA